jgi:TolB-like protein
MSLAEKVKTGALPEKEISELGGQIADALEEAHEGGVVHRDLKPGNIALTPKGRVKVLDFGLARMLRPVSDEASTEALTETHGVAGTLPYMSPEELRGERADHRSDIYSFGVVLYEMATGRRPFEEKLSTRLTDAILHQAPDPPSTHNRKVSPGLEGVILKALDKDPEHRYQSAREMRVDLERLRAPVSWVAPKLRKAARGWMWAAGAVAVVAVLVGVGFLVLGGGEGPAIDSIAVLPLDNLSGDPEQEYFSDGMHDALISNLAKIGALRIISRQSVMRFKDADTPIPEIARLLNVDAIVEGSVLRSGDRVRITTQLIQAEPERHLWEHSMDMVWLKGVPHLQNLRDDPRFQDLLRRMNFPE